MNRYEDDVVVPVHQFHDLMDPTLVIRHLNQASENTHAMVDMNDIVAQVERTQVIECQLLGLFHRPAQAHPVETVEDLMVRITANPVLMVYEPRMDVLSFDKFRQERMFILQHNGTEALQLGLFLTIDIDLVVVFQLGPDIGKQQFEVLVEHRLRSNRKGDAVRTLARKRNFQENMSESSQFRKEGLLFIHIRRIQPDNRIFL